MPERNLIIRYWGRKPSDLAKKYLTKYTKPDDVVLDSFGGSGMFIKVALEMGRQGIYVDLNPFAKLIAQSSIQGCDVNKYREYANKILSRKTLPIKRKGKIGSISRKKIFSVKCLCGKDVEAKYIAYTRIYKVKKKVRDLSGVKSKVFNVVAKKTKISHDELLKSLGNTSTQVISNATKWLVKNKYLEEKEIPYLITFTERCSCGRIKIKPNGKIWSISAIKPYYWYPTTPLNYNTGEPFFKKRDVEYIHEFFTDRTLALLSTIWRDICSLKVNSNVKRCLILTFLATLARSSKMCRLNGGTWPINSYWVPRTYVIKNPYLVFETAQNQIVKWLNNKQNIKWGGVKDVLSNHAKVAFILRDAKNLGLPPSSIDYVIVDPPHTDEAQFFELSVFYTSWLDQKMKFDKELVINPHQKKNIEKYLEMLRKAAANIFYALKPRKYFTAILHEEDKEILEKSKKVVESTGFRLVEKTYENDYILYTFKK